MVNENTMEIKSWRITTMFRFLFWIGLYLAVIMIGGHAGAGWAIVASLMILYGIGIIFKKKIENNRSRCNDRKDKED